MAHSPSLAAEIAQSCLAMRLRRATRAITRLYDEELREFGIGIAQFNLLVAASVAGAVAPSRLGAALELEKSTLSRVLARMAAEGWVAVTPAGRGRRVRTTSEGRALLVRAHAAWRRAQAKARALLQRDLVQALETITVP